MRLITFYIETNTIGDERGFDVGEVYENLGVENVENDKLVDKPALLQNAISQAATIKANAKKLGKGDAAAKDDEGPGRRQPSKGGGKGYYARGGNKYDSGYRPFYGRDRDRYNDRRSRSRSPDRHSGRSRSRR